METQIMNTNSGPQPAYRSPQAQSASAPMFHPVTPQGQPLGRPYRDEPRVSGGYPQSQPSRPVGEPQQRPQPVFNGKPVRSVDERHDAFQRAKEALHDRHYEDNNLRLQAEIALAEFFLA